MGMGIGNTTRGVARSSGQPQVPKLEPQRNGHFSCLSYYAPWIGIQSMFSNPRTLVQPKLSGI